ncbi:MAG: hypothetical protein QOJ64_3121 [Acidobacteriota bacterium]|jgi:hypothetical protein|nr:hypothetical protein [Acidobacteriota bacterium]
MPKKDADDPNLFAKSVLDQIVAKHDPESIEGKDAKKVASGLKGGSKGGLIRAHNLSSQERKAIAKKAAKARWKKVKSTVG